MNKDTHAPPSPVESIALKNSPYELIYPPSEKIGAIVVPHFPALGKLAAMRFMEWVQENPEGIISLPTGKTPEHFIHWVKRLLTTWDERDTRTELERSGVDPARRPDMRGLHFAQIDEFYPINPWQQNSFYYYVNHFYLDGFGLDPARALLMDCSRIGLDEGQKLEDIWPGERVDLSLRYRNGENALERMQKEILHRIDDWCQNYEERIRALGGIGFFLGGIGPDGHVGFNVRGSDHHFTTRLTPTNYETQAAAATSLGGIEISRTRPVITIGLGTITYNPDCVALIIAAGEAKSSVVADGIEKEPNVLYPATALHKLSKARFYITSGAGGGLHARRLARIESSESVDTATADVALIDLAVKLQKRIEEITPEEAESDPIARAVIARRPESLNELCSQAGARMAGRIERGVYIHTGKRFLHTEPHHDDIMLGYLPHVVRHGKEASNTHYFACMTGGFTSVTNSFMRRQLELVERFIETPEFQALLREGYFEPDNETARNRDVWQYLDGVAANRPRWRDEGIARRMLRNLLEVMEQRDIRQIGEFTRELEYYFDTQYPGKKDPEHVQALKSMCREWEAECLWGFFGWNCSNVFHLRLGFYTGDIFTEEPTVERDVPPVLALLEKIQPDIVTVALDPEGSGPDTHYKVLEVMSEALRRYEKKSGRSDILVWGYRNVWYRFHPADANVHVPVSMYMFSILQDAFKSTFNSQRDASFPSHEYDGPFSELAQRIQVEQYQMMKFCLGRRWFHEHESALMRATRGFIFIQEMKLPEFYAHARELKQLTENR